MTSSGRNQSAISRWADSGLSLPWTQIILLADREIAANRSGRGGHAIGRPQHGPHDRDRLVPLEHADDHRRTGDELDQPFEKRLALMLGIMFLGQAARSTAINLSAAIRRPLVSNRSRIVPTSRRWTQSGLKMIRVRCMELKVIQGFEIRKNDPVV